MPHVAIAAAHAAVEDKRTPQRIEDGDFFEGPKALRRTLARLVGADPGEIVLGNSTTHGLDLLARGLGLEEGDEILLAEGDYPATVYPWIPLESRGVRISTVPNRNGAPDPEDLREALTARTRVVCMSWVFSLTGNTADVPALVEVCRDHGEITFVLNGSQAVGARPTKVGELGVDALVCCGFKWLCGPYATGFTWLRGDLVESLDHRQGYWLAHVDDIGRLPDEYRLREDLGAAAYDVFCTANLQTYPAWERAVSLLLDTGLDAIAAYDQSLVQRLIDGLPAGWTLQSPREGPARSTLVFVGTRDRGTTEMGVKELKAAGLDVGFRDGSMRISPHVHNTADQIDRALEALWRA